MYKPKSKKELIDLIVDCYYGKLYLKDIDTSLITNMSELFDYGYYYDKYNIDINRIWENSNNDISKWDTSNVTNMVEMFSSGGFNGDISKWDISNVDSMSWMFAGSDFLQDISIWALSLNPGVNMQGFNENSFNSEIYGRVDSYDDFIKTVRLDSVNQYVENIMSEGDIQERYRVIRKLNRIKHII